MSTNFCQRCLKFVCTCVVTASIVGLLSGIATANVQGDLPSDHAVGVLTAGTTGATGTASQIHVVHNEITDQEYIVVRPDQRGQPALGPTGPGPAGGNWRPKVVSMTGPTGAYAGSSGREFPKGPTGATG
jgi:hypothetical protein